MDKKERENILERLRIKIMLMEFEYDYLNKKNTLNINQ